MVCVVSPRRLCVRTVKFNRASAALAKTLEMRLGSTYGRSWSRGSRNEHELKSARLRQRQIYQVLLLGKIFCT
jgi:hypothetical protein